MAIRAVAALLCVACCSAFFAPPLHAGGQLRGAHAPAARPAPTPAPRAARRAAAGWSWLWARWPASTTAAHAAPSSGGGAGGVDKADAQAELEKLTVPQVARPALPAADMLHMLGERMRARARTRTCARAESHVHAHALIGRPGSCRHGGGCVWPRAK